MSPLNRTKNTQRCLRQVRSDRLLDARGVPIGLSIERIRLKGHGESRLGGRMGPGPNLIRSGDRPWSLAGRRTSQVFTRDGEFPHEGVQCGPGHSEAGRSLADHSAGFAEHAKDMLPLDVLQRATPAGCAALDCISDKGARRLGPLERITALSMKFSSSRMLPGHRHATSALIVSERILSIWRPIFAERTS